jgi:sugar (pentulose or hexulose) kinase
MATRTIAAVDLGAESGRVILARFDGQNVSLEEVHRFPNRPVMLRGHRFWNILALWDETLTGLRKARQLAGTLDSVSLPQRLMTPARPSRPRRCRSQVVGAISVPAPGRW